MKKYVVTLTAAEREHLAGLIAAGKAAAQKLAHARILLKADAADGGPGWTDDRIAEAVEVSTATVERVRGRFVAAGLDAALSGQCLSRRIGSVAWLRQVVAAWEAERNEREVGVDWRFTTADARVKLRRLHPAPQMC